jgi:hypothetical protein
MSSSRAVVTILVASVVAAATTASAGPAIFLKQTMGSPTPLDGLRGFRVAVAPLNRLDADSGRDCEAEEIRAAAEAALRAGGLTVEREDPKDELGLVVVALQALPLRDCSGSASPLVLAIVEFRRIVATREAPTERIRSTTFQALALANVRPAEDVPVALATLAPKGPPCIELQALTTELVSAFVGQHVQR